MIRFLLICLSLVSAASPAPRTPPPSAAAELFAKLKPLVFQLKTAVRADAPKRSYGSAFVVAKEGWLVTNYHVVSDAVQYPKKYRVYLEDEEESLEATILALDVVHDLALVSVARTFPRVLAIRGAQPRQGARLYSLGLPSDLNLSIIEGVFNDSLVHGTYEEYHLSSPLNGGMSGGPTVDVEGHVVGVNVAVLRDSQNVSFAVPGRYAEDLLAAAQKPRGLASAAKADWHLEIQRQLSGVQARLTDDLLEAGEERTRLDGWSVPRSPDYLKCWGDDASDPKRRFHGYTQVCTLPMSAFLSDSVSTGTAELRYEVFAPGELNRFQFTTLIEAHYNEPLDLENVSLGSFWEDDKRLVTEFHCSDLRFKSSRGVDWKANYCLRGYLRYPDLVDVDFKWGSVVRSGSALLVKGTLRGFHRDNVTKLFRQQWENTIRERK